MDDLISRQAAIDELDKGVWGVEWDKTLANSKCSVCGHRENCWLRNVVSASYFCPNCGADMRGEQDDQNTSG